MHQRKILKLESLSTSAVQLNLIDFEQLVLNPATPEAVEANAQVAKKLSRRPRKKSNGITSSFSPESFAKAYVREVLEEVKQMVPTEVFEQVELFTSIQAPKNDILIDMTLGDVLGMHDNVLLHCMHLLKDTRTNEDRRAELISWIIEPFVEEKATPLPFSFQACAMSAGCDPETLRAGLLIAIGLRGLVDNSIDKEIMRVRSWH